jgi:mannitol-1-phosphate/altronate dehydrogenase
VNINTIKKEDWIKHYTNLWFSLQAEEDNREEEENKIDNEITEDITMEELNETLKRSKNRKSPGLDTINTELFKYGGSKLQECVLRL